MFLFEYFTWSKVLSNISVHIPDIHSLILSYEHVHPHHWMHGSSFHAVCKIIPTKVKFCTILNMLTKKIQCQNLNTFEFQQ